MPLIIPLGHFIIFIRKARKKIQDKYSRLMDIAKKDISHEDTPRRQIEISQFRLEIEKNLCNPVNTV